MARAHFVKNAQERADASLNRKGIRTLQYILGFPTYKTRREEYGLEKPVPQNR